MTARTTLARTAGEQPRPHEFDTFIYAALEDTRREVSQQKTRQLLGAASLALESMLLNEDLRPYGITDTALLDETSDRLGEDRCPKCGGQRVAASAGEPANADHADTTATGGPSSEPATGHDNADPGPVPAGTACHSPTSTTPGPEAADPSAPRSTEPTRQTQESKESMHHGATTAPAPRPADDGTSATSHSGSVSEQSHLNTDDDPATSAGNTTRVVPIGIPANSVCDTSGDDNAAANDTAPAPTCRCQNPAPVTQDSPPPAPGSPQGAEAEKDAGEPERLFELTTPAGTEPGSRA